MRPVERRLLAVAAAALLAVFGLGGYTAMMRTAPDTSVVDGELHTFSSEFQIKRLISSMDDSPVFKVYRSGNSATEEVLDYSTDSDSDFSDMDLGAAEDADMETEMQEYSSSTKSLRNSATTGATGSASHSETYLQVEEVDESDIVKTDGKYIYYVNKNKEVVILSAENGKTKKISTIGNNGVENYVQDIYLKGDRLITVGRFYKNDSDEASSGIVVYDISDRSKPVEIYDFSQTGSIVSSRMVGDYVYLVTNETVWKGGRVVPMCGSRDSFKSLPAVDICCVPDPNTSSYIILSGIDIASGKQGKTTTKAVLGASSDIYCNDHNLYATSSEWDSKTGTVYTRIVRAALDKENVKFNATTKVRGRVYGQFAMDERDGYFRIATTSDRDGMDVNNLYVLDSVLKEAGKVTGFARNESIKAVRFIGSKAYVITYKAIDPLFIIDLSDPADPRIEGEVMIDGFSTLLVPVSGDRLLGIGHATGDNGYGGEYDSGLKLALFDISDPSEPKVIDSKEFKDMTSPATDDHHALTVNTEAGYYAIPYDIYRWIDVEGDTDDEDILTDDDVVENDAEDVLEDDAEDIEDAEAKDENEEDGDEAEEDGDDIDVYEEEPVDYFHEAGVLVFKAGDKITSVDQHRLGSEYLYRAVYIGDYIYALDGEGNVSSFRPKF